MIPPKLLKEILADKYYKRCARHEDGNCGGRITFEHTLLFKGKQIQEKWSLIPLCEYHHDVLSYQDIGELNKEKNVWIALNRATDEELLKYSKAINYLELRDRLNKKYEKNTNII